MSDIFYWIYFKRFNTQWIDVKYNHFCIKMINKLFPLFYQFSKPALSSKAIDKSQCIVSLTTFPARIEKVWLTIESILRQKNKPDAIILWLYEGEFNGKSSLPTTLLNLEKRGLQIRFCDENLLPHKKYFFALKEFPAATIITIDDDMIYPSDLLANLFEAHNQFPKAICCAISREIKFFNGVLLPYQHWNYIMDNTSPSYKFLIMGGGGALFPPHALGKEVFNVDRLRELALRADDLWLKTMSLLNKTKIACISGQYSRFPVPIIQKNKLRLMDENIGQGQNDKIINELMDYYKIPISIFDSK